MVKDAFGRPWPLLDMAACVGSGWRGLIERLYALCDTEEVSVFQVKEKYGGLRFYVGVASDRVLDAIEAAESESMTICETCGEPGKPVEDAGWWRTTCETHK